MRPPGGHHDDLAGPNLVLLVVDEERRPALLNYEHLRVGVAVQ